MRKLFVLVLLASSAYCANAQTIDSIIQQLEGCWRWDYYYGGFPGLPPTPATHNVYTEFYRDGADSLAGNTISTNVFAGTELKFNGRCNVTEHPSDDYFLLSCPLFDSVGVAGSPPVYFNFEGDTLLFPQQEFVDGFVYAFTKTCGDTISGVEHLAETTVLLYPNPASEQITLDFKDGKPVQVSLYNAFGTSIASFDTKNQTRFKIDVVDFPEGVYFLRISTGERMFTRKFVLAR